MSARNAKGRNRGRETAQASSTDSKRESMSTIKPEDFAELFRPLEGEAPKVRLHHPGSKTETPASSVYFDAQASKDYNSRSPSMQGCDSDGSMSPYEMMEDEATRDLVRTPSPDEFYPKPEKSSDTNSCAEPQNPSGSNRSTSLTKKREQSRVGNPYSSSAACVLKEGEDPSVFPEAADHREVPSNNKRQTRKKTLLQDKRDHI